MAGRHPRQPQVLARTLQPHDLCHPHPALPACVLLPQEDQPWLQFHHCGIPAQLPGRDVRRGLQHLRPALDHGATRPVRPLLPPLPGHPLQPHPPLPLARAGMDGGHLHHLDRLERDPPRKGRPGDLRHLCADTASPVRGPVLHRPGSPRVLPHSHATAALHHPDHHVRRLSRLEDADMERLHGEEFLRYRREVPAFFPRWRPCATSPGAQPSRPAEGG